MNRSIAGLFAILAAGVLTPAAALACDDSAGCLRAVADAQRQIQSLSARFVQTKRLALLEEPIRSTGVFAFQRPDQVLWRIDDPPFEVRVLGTEVRLPPVGGEAMPSMPPGLTSLLGGISAMFTGDTATAAARFDIEAVRRDDAIVVRMRPKTTTDRRLIESIRLTFVGPERELRRIELEENVGDRLEIVFHDSRRNDASAAAVFAEP